MNGFQLGSSDQILNNQIKLPGKALLEKPGLCNSAIMNWVRKEQPNNKKHHEKGQNWALPQTGSFGIHSSFPISFSLSFRVQFS